MSNTTPSAVRIAWAWRRAYRDWEQGRLPSPSVLDLVADALAILQVQANALGQHNLEAIIDRHLEQGKTLTYTAERVVAYCNGSETVAPR
jgi:hypothetical protein